jgi:hypothetical protein
LAASGQEECVETLRPDGTRRIFAVPVLPLHAADIDMLAQGVSP